MTTWLGFQLVLVLVLVPVLMPRPLVSVFLVYLLVLLVAAWIPAPLMRELSTVPLHPWLGEQSFLPRICGCCSVDLGD